MKKKQNLILIILLLITLTLTIVNINLLNKKIIEPMKHNDKIKDEYEQSLNPKVEESKTKSQSEIDKKTQEEYLAKLKKMGERDRMETYFGKYISFIEKKEYDKAYALLYPEFKDNYFKTLEDFTKYVKEKYPSSMIAVRYNDIERQGDYYILFVKIVNPLAAKSDENSLNQKIVIYEKDFDNFVLSFSV